jgi:hypothetical protein
MEPLFFQNVLTSRIARDATHANEHGWPSDFAFVDARGARHKPPHELTASPPPWPRFDEIAAFSSLCRLSLVIRFGA